MALFDSHHDAITDFPGILVSNWNVALNTWNTARDSEDVGSMEDTSERARMAQTPHHPDKRENIDLDMMALDTFKL